MSYIDLGRAMNAAENDEFWAVRGKAVQAYANLEQSLCRIFGQLSGTTPEIAGIIFFKIVNSGARDSILEKLFKKKYPVVCSPFWKSLLKQLPSIAQERNAIVHWNVINNVGLDETGLTTSVVVLRPPIVLMDMASSAESINTADMIAFDQKCTFFAAICTMFHAVTTSAGAHMADEDRRIWLDIFEQPIVYPPTETHPLFSVGR